MLIKPRKGGVYKIRFWTKTIDVVVVKPSKVTSLVQKRAKYKSDQAGLIKWRVRNESLFF